MKRRNKMVVPKIPFRAATAPTEKISIPDNFLQLEFLDTTEPCFEFITTYYDPGVKNATDVVVTNQHYEDKTMTIYQRK